MVSYVQSLLANFVSAYHRITTWPPQKKKKKISFFLFPAPLGQICFVLVLISPNHKARNRYPEMVMARTVFRASGDFLVFCLSSHWLLVIASLSLIGRCDVFCVGFITRQRKALGWNKCFYFFLSFGHLRVSDGFVLLHKKGASGVLCSLNKVVLLNLSRGGKINFLTGRAICSIFKGFKRFQALIRDTTGGRFYRLPP